MGEVAEIFPSNHGGVALGEADPLPVKKMGEAVEIFASSNGGVALGEAEAEADPLCVEKMGDAVEIVPSNSGGVALGDADPKKMGEAVDVEMLSSNNDDGALSEADPKNCVWYDEELDDDLRWSFALNSTLHTGVSEYQQIALLDTKHFGVALMIDGMMQSAESDEFVYHECLIHPSFIYHPNPQTVFIMGGGEGSAAREALKHKSIQKVVMCDIDQEVVDFCRKHLAVNFDTFHNPKLDLVINDAREELEKREEKYDMIVGDLADPVDGGPCYKLYTQSFYQNVVKPKLNHSGIFVTQAGPAGVLSHKLVFSSIYNTLKHVFKYVIAYTAHVPSFLDTWGWIMASDEPFSLDVEQIDQRIKERINGELLYLNGATFMSSKTLNKIVHQALLKETHVYTENDARFLHGHGKAYSA